MSTPNSSFENSAAIVNTSPELLNLPADSEIWESLKHAISASSGFQRWQLELGTESEKHSGLDHLIRRYLRETLETLAY